MFNSFWLALEIPIYMRHFKFLRVISIGSGIIYNVFYLLGILQIYHLEYWTGKDDISQYDALAIMEIMFIWYSLVMHSGIVIINCGIMLKEFTMEFFQFVNRTANDGLEENLSLGAVDIFLYWNDLLWLLNPLSWDWANIA